MTSTVYPKRNGEIFKISRSRNSALQRGGLVGSKALTGRVNNHEPID